jgi:CBS domain-containing protein
MPAADSVQRVRIYLSRDDRWEGGPRYLAILEELRRSGATGATALQGLAGFGPGQRSRLAAPARPDQHQPVVIEWVERAERVARLLPLLDSLLGDALVTVEDVPIYRAMLRARGPFAADNTVGDAMRSPAPYIPADAPLSAAIAAMAEGRIATLPVADAAGRLAGLITAQELAWRAGLRLPLELLGALAPAERDAALAPLLGRAAHEVMNVEPRSVSPSTSLPQALVTMVEWGYAQVPVVDREGALLGLLGDDDVLRAAVEQTPAESPAVRDAEPPVTVGLVMQTVVAHVRAEQRLGQALPQLIVAPGQPLLALDAAGRLAGALDLAAALDALAADERAALLAALQRPQATPAAPLPDSDIGLAELIAPDLPTIGPEATLLAAARRLLELGAERLAVVAADGVLLGIIARGGLVRALMQQSD